MLPGELLEGKYRLIGQLGAGGMGAVWEAINERTGRRVALKSILEPSPERRERLLREARACGRLSHPNIVDLYDVGQTEAGEPFLVLARLTGKTLEDLLKERRRLEPRLVARIGRDIANALAAAHSAHVVHRDLKPSNVFLHRDEGMTDGDFIVKVIDFGIAKDYEAGAGAVTSTGMVIGSPAYMSPEQLSAAKDIDGRTDLWSLGVILYESLAGVRPFDGTLHATMAKILTADVLPIAAHVPDFPSELDRIVLDCLVKDRRARISTAVELTRRLSGFLDALDRRSESVLPSMAGASITTQPLPAEQAASTAPLPETLKENVESKVAVPQDVVGKGRRGVVALAFLFGVPVAALLAGGLWLRGAERAEGRASLPVAPQSATLGQGADGVLVVEAASSKAPPAVSIAPLQASSAVVLAPPSDVVADVSPTGPTSATSVRPASSAPAAIGGKRVMVKRR